ncbi:MAG: hypothetical protein CMD52_05870 [Gammaproteobacteria bacterium]|nr:hypothetical protein [Gammaproteobacteria bacterium]
MQIKKYYLLLLFLLASSISFSQTAENFYAGRTITILVGSGAGGTTDISSRVIAEHLKRHIPGNPAIIVQNLPGGGSVTMTNYLYRSAPKDGSVLGYSLPGIITAQMMEPRRARFDGRKLNWIGSALKYTGIISVMSTSPATTIEQAKDTELFIGTTGRGSPAHQFPMMAQALLNLKFNIVAGYESSNDVVFAMERGEVHGQSSSLQAWAITRPDWLADNRITPLLYMGPPDPLAVPGVPYLRQLVSSTRQRALVDFIEIGSQMGWPLFAPPEVPVNRVETLRTAFNSLMNDPEFIQAIGLTVRAELQPTSGSELTLFVETSLETPDTILSEAKSILGLDGR